MIMTRLRTNKDHSPAPLRYGIFRRQRDLTKRKLFRLVALCQGRLLAPAVRGDWLSYDSLTTDAA